MGGSSKTSSSQESKTTYGNTSTVNPYYETKTDDKGNTVSNFKQGTAGQTTYDFVNQNISGLLDNYLNPSLNSATNQARMNAFTKNLNTESSNALQNNIINPLANNNMIRSSQATNMYNNLSNQMNDKIADYSNELIANDQASTQDMINTLMGLYTTGYTGANTEENASLKASSGNATTTGKSSGKA